MQKYELILVNKLLGETLDIDALADETKQKLHVALNQIIDKFHTNEQLFIKERYGLNEEEPKTLEKLSSMFDKDRDSLRKWDTKLYKKLSKTKFIAQLKSCL